MKRLCLLSALVCLGGCESFTTGPNAPWGSIGGVQFVPSDAFFLQSVQPNADFNYVLIVANQVGYCTMLQQNLNAYPSNITFATFTISNPIGTGPVNPPPGTYPITAAYGAASSAQATYGSVSATCVASPVLTGTTGNVVMNGVAVDGSAIAGTVDVGFGSSGTLSGNFNAGLCDTSNSTEGASVCLQ